MREEKTFALALSKAEVNKWVVCRSRKSQQYQKEQSAAYRPPHKQSKSIVFERIVYPAGKICAEKYRKDEGDDKEGGEGE